MYIYIYIYVAETPTCGYLTRRHIPEGASVPLMALTNGVVGSAWIVCSGRELLAVMCTMNALAS